MILVTGGTGLLGNCVIRELLAKGQRVRALCRPGTSKEPLAGLELEVFEGELSQPEILRRAAKGCQAVIHSAAFIHLGWTRLAESRRVNVEGTRHIVEACLVNEAKLVHISTVDTLPAAFSIDNPISEETETGIPKIPCNYVLSKREADDVVRCAVREQGLQATVIHPGFMLGPYDWKPSSGRLMLGVVHAPLAIAPDGGCSLCDARDVAAGIIRAVEHGRQGQSYILAGCNMPYSDLWNRILQVANRKKRVLSLPLAVGLVGKLIDTAHRILPLREGDINGASIAMGRFKHYYDSTRARQELDYHSRSPDQTLQDAWEWLSHRFR